MTFEHLLAAGPAASAGRSVPPPGLDRGHPCGRAQPPVSAVEVLAAAAVVAVLWGAGACFASLPTVYRTWPDRACVAVRPAEAGDCADVTARHHTVWVAEDWRPEGGE